jgi:hypothetical protein
MTQLETSSRHPQPLRPILSPRDLAHLHETDASRGTGGFLFESAPGGEVKRESPAANAEATAADTRLLERHANLPAEAYEQAEQQTQNMYRLYALGQHNEAFAAGRLALAHWHALHEHAQSCAALCVLSAACMEHEQGVEALALARHALRLARMRMLAPALVQALTLLGVLHGRLHDVAVGESLVMQALSRARELHQRPLLMQTLEALLEVLLEAHEVQRLAGDTHTMKATAQRLQRHANHALAQSGPLPDNYTEVQLRTLAASALVVCGRSTDAMPVLVQCIELARQAGYNNVGLWARLYNAQAQLQAGDDATAWDQAQALAPLLSADQPPRLRLKHLSLQTVLAERTGRSDVARDTRAAAHALRDTLLRQRLKLRATLRRNADDVLQTLSVLDREWQERGAPALLATRPPASAPGADSQPVSKA